MQAIKWFVSSFWGYSPLDHWLQTLPRISFLQSLEELFQIHFGSISHPTILETKFNGTVATTGMEAVGYLYRCLGACVDEHKCLKTLPIIFFFINFGWVILDPFQINFLYNNLGLKFSGTVVSTTCMEALLVTCIGVSGHVLISTNAVASFLQDSEGIFLLLNVIQYKSCIRLITCLLHLPSEILQHGIDFLWLWVWFVSYKEHMNPVLEHNPATPWTFFQPSLF